MIKIVFLEPDFDFHYRHLLEEGRTYAVPPLWALYLGTYLKERIRDVKIDILDCQFFSMDKLEEWTKKNKPDFAGISPKFLNYESTIRAARIFKKYNAKVVLGGTHSNSLRNGILKNRGPFSDDYCIDAIIQRDGEKAFFEYVKGKSLDKINNLIWHNGEEIKENKIELLDLNSLPMPDRSLIDSDMYVKKSNIFSVLSQKGCSWQEKSGGCIFCAQELSKLRFRDPVSIWKEIDFLRKKYNVKTIWDSSENFFNDLNWIDKFWKVSKKYKNRPEFKIFVRLSDVDENNVKILKDLKVVEIILGVESGSIKSLAAFNKGIVPRLIKEKINLLHKHGIKTFHCYIFGAPNETRKTLIESMEFAKDIAKSKYHAGTRFNVVAPYPGSSMWQMLLKDYPEEYIDKDIINWKLVRTKWIENYCDIDIKSFMDEFEKAKKISIDLNEKAGLFQKIKKHK